MADFEAKEYIAMQQEEEGKAQNFRNLYQDVANFMMPRENQITSERTAGEDKSIVTYDPTAMMDLDDMVSGLSNAFFPPGQQSFNLTVDNRELANRGNVKHNLALASQITHDRLFASNFMLQLNETLTSLVGFGTGNLFSEYIARDYLPLGLNFKAWDIPVYTFKQDHTGRVDTAILKFQWPARQAYQQWGDDAGEKVLEDIKELRTESKRHWFIHTVRPRRKRNPALQDVLNMPFESVFVNVKDEKIIEEGGFHRQPYAIPRWKKSPSEKYGRGQGTVALAGVKTQQVMWRDFIEYGNKVVNMPREVLDTFEGPLRVTPGAQNPVSEIPSTRVIELGSQNAPIAKEAMEMQANAIHRAFFVDVFAPLANLPGDRRTTVEIYQRVAQAMKKLAAPIYRLQTELFTPVIERVVLLLIEHGEIQLVPELYGQKFGIEYVSELAMAMRDQQARAFERAAMMTTELAAIFPTAPDILNVDRALPDIYLTYGMKAEHLNTKEEKAAIRQKREDDIAQQKLAMAAQVAGGAYKDMSKKAEEDSPSEQLQGALTGT